MKKMKMSEKVFRTLLIGAMGLTLTGVTLATAFATYEIKIEHIFDDFNNGTTVSGAPETYTPRDDLIDDLGDSDLKVEYEGDHRDENGNKLKDKEGNEVNYSGNSGASGTANGDNLGINQAVDIANDLLGKLKDKDGNINLDAEKKLNDIKNKLDNCQNPDEMKETDEDGNVVDKYPVKTKPEGDAPPAEPPVMPKAEVEDPGEKPEVREQQEGESKEDYDAYVQNFKDTILKDYNEQYEKYTADQKRLEAEMAKYEADKEAFENKSQEWKDWEAYQNAMKTYLANMDTLSDELQSWFKQIGKPLDGLDSDKLYDKALQESYQKAYLNVCKELDKLFTTDDDGNSVIDFDKLDEVTKNLNDMKGGLSDLSGDVTENYWQAEKKTFDESADEKLNLFNFKAWLSDESKKALEDASYTTSKNPYKITVVCVKKNADGSEIEETYISMDNGGTWYKDGNQDNEPANTDEILENGFVTNAITFTFLHQWAPNWTPSNPPKGDTVDVEPKYIEPTHSVPPSETPDPTPVPTPPADTELEEPDTPLNEVELPLEDVPLTGDVSYLWYAAALISTAGLLFLVYRSKKTA